MTTRRALDGQVCALMTGLCAIWGFQQVAIKASAADMAAAEARLVEERPRRSLHFVLAGIEQDGIGRADFDPPLGLADRHPLIRFRQRATGQHHRGRKAQGHNMSSGHVFPLTFKIND